MLLNEDTNAPKIREGTNGSADSDQTSATEESVSASVHHDPIFLDTTGRRARLVRRTGYVVTGICATYTAMLGLSFAGATPIGPNTLLPLPGVPSEPLKVLAKASAPEPDPTTPAPHASAAAGRGGQARTTLGGGKGPSLAGPLAAMIMPGAQSAGQTVAPAIVPAKPARPAPAQPAPGGGGTKPPPTTEPTPGPDESAPPEDPPAEDPPAEDPPAEDPPAEDPPAEDPPAEDPPAEDPPAEDPPAEDPPAEDPPADDSGDVLSDVLTPVGDVLGDVLNPLTGMISPALTSSALFFTAS